MRITGIGRDIPRLGSCVPSASSEVLPCFKVIISVYLNSLCGYQKVNRCIRSKREIGSEKWCQKWLSSCYSLIISFAKQTLCPHKYCHVDLRVWLHHKGYPESPQTGIIKACETGSTVDSRHTRIAKLKKRSQASWKRLQSFLHAQFLHERRSQNFLWNIYEVHICTAVVDESDPVEALIFSGFFLPIA